jgi:hypothetical protein
MPVPFFHRQARRNYKSNSATGFHRSILAFTNSANRAVINSKPQLRNCEGVSCSRRTLGSHSHFPLGLLLLLFSGALPSRECLHS